MNKTLLFIGSAICLFISIFVSAHINKTSREKIFVKISVMFLIGVLIGEGVLCATSDLFVGANTSESMIQSAAPDVGTYLLVKAEYKNGAYHIWYAENNDTISEDAENMVSENIGDGIGDGDIYVFAYTVRIRPTSERADKVEFTEDGSCYLYISVLKHNNSKQ